MKKLLPIFVIIVASCKPSSEQILTAHTWTIDKMINLETKRMAPNEIGQGSTFKFNEDGTFVMERGSAMGDWSYKGSWELKDSILNMREMEDTVSVKVLKLTSSKLIWTSDYLGSKGKFILIPNN